MNDAVLQALIAAATGGGLLKLLETWLKSRQGNTAAATDMRGELARRVHELEAKDDADARALRAEMEQWQARYFQCAADLQAATVRVSEFKTRLEGLENATATALTRAEQAEARANELANRIAELELLLRETQTRYLRLQGEHDALKLKHDALQAEHDTLLLRVARG